MSRLAHTSATLLSGVVSPRIVAQPCCSTYFCPFQESFFLNSLSFWSLSESVLNFATQNGVRRSATALAAISSAIALAVPPVIQPPHLNPTIASRIAPPAAL